MKRILNLLILAPILFALAVLGAINLGGEVVQLETTNQNGARLTTSLWVAEINGNLWLRAGRPTADWLQRIRENPVAKITRDGQVLDVKATLIDSYAPQINRAMREKYGWADVVISLIHDSEAVVAVRLMAPRV